jgi:hypothetical protein
MPACLPACLHVRVGVRVWTGMDGIGMDARMRLIELCATS